jgi:pyridoxal phosphate enzyme (YggS family)
VQIKISDEESKSGLAMDAADDFLSSFAQYKNLKLEGLMGIGPLDASDDETRLAFRKLKNIFDRHVRRFGEKPVLSMGMTDDFEMAIEEGSTLVRIGRGLFGERENA